MLSALNRLKAFFTLCVSLLIVFCLLLSAGTAANADETETAITPAMQEIIDMIDTLPADAELITIAHKDPVIKIKTGYEKLTDDEKIAFPSDKYNIYSASELALTPYLLDDVATRIEALNKKIKKSDKKEVLAIYDDYMLLSAEAQSALSEKNTKKLLAAVKTVQGNDNAADKQGFSINFETVIIIVLSCLITVNLILFAIVIVKLLSKKRERTRYEDESN